MSKRGWASDEFNRRVVQHYRAMDAPCCRCGGAIDYGLSGSNPLGPSADHLVPLMHGGEIEPAIEDMGVAHFRCNSRHGARIRNLNEARNRGADLPPGVQKAPPPFPNDPPHDDRQPFPPVPAEAPGVMGWQGAYEGDGGPFVAVGGRLPPPWEDVRWMGDLLRLPPTATWPRIMSAPHPRAVNSLGREVVARIEARRESDPLTPRRAKRLRWWQKLIIYRMYEVDGNGELCWRKVLVSTSRQVGKSVGLREIALDRMAAWDHFGEPQLILHVAKDLSIADEIQRPARQWANMVGDPWHGVGGNGRWAVEHTGMMGRWIVRSQTAVYGYSASAALIDEAWAIDVEHITEGIEPTMVEREQPQMLMISTAHREATSLFPDLRVPALRRLATPVDDVLLLEWSAPPGADPHHVAAHRMASPHWDERRAAFILSKVDQAGFQEQWLNVWPEVGGQVATLAPREIVDRCARTLEIAPTADGRTFVLYPTLDQTTWHVLTGARVGDEIQVKVDGSHRSLRKATEHVARMAAKGNPSDLLIPRHIRGRVPRLPGVRTTIQASDADLTAATTSVRPLLLDGRVVHDGPEALADQMVGAVLDEYGETVRISSKHSPGQVELAKAAMLAAWWASREDRPTAVIV